MTALATFKITTLGDRIRIKVDEPKVGVLSTEGQTLATEVGEVIGVGNEVTLPLKVGDRILFKAWSVDIVNINGERFIFISQSTNGICCKIK